MALKLKRLSDGKPLFALVPVPAQVAAFWELPRSSGGRTRKSARRFFALESFLILFLDQLFPGCEVAGQRLFRLIRDSDVEIEEEAEDLVREFEARLKRRRLGSVVRVEARRRSMPDDLRRFILEGLQGRAAGRRHRRRQAGTRATGATDPARSPGAEVPAFQPRFPERIRDHGGDCFAAIREKDILVHHPFESFDVVVQFLRQAAQDPNVIAIKQTLYRTRKDSPIVAALIEAAENGKNVTALVEIKARFDEEANLKWARDLERAGVHVVFGFVEYKTHAKLVDRRPARGRGASHLLPLRHRQLSPGHGEDLHGPVAVHLPTRRWRAIPAGCSTTSPAMRCPTSWRSSSYSPVTLKTDLLRLIAHEAEHAKAGKPAGDLGQDECAGRSGDHRRALSGEPGGRLDRADHPRRSAVCRPGVPGLSDNIRVKSIVGRFLEHARIVAFANGSALPSPKARVFISSADWMPRNLDRRVEVLVPVENPTVHQQVLDQIMVANINDEAQSWDWTATVATTARPGGTRKRLFGARLLHDQPQPLRAGPQGEGPAPRVRACRRATLVWRI